MMDVPLFLRADASPVAGTGHVMRMLALGHAWRDLGYGPVTFLPRQLPDALRDRLAREGFAIRPLGPCAVQDGEASAILAEVRGTRRGAEGPPAWIALDGYQFPAECQTALLQAGCRVLVVDDNGENGRYTATLVLNQNLHASDALYANRPRSTALLLGPRYALLRNEFVGAPVTAKHFAPASRHVLITMGGADPARLTEAALQAVQGLDADVRVLVGGGNPRLAGIRDRAGARVQVLTDVRDMPAQFAWADLAIAAAGSTVWELCLAGVPSVVMSGAPNQDAVAASLSDAGVAMASSPSRLREDVAALAASAEARAALADRASRLVDGRGARRVAGEMFARVLRLRDAGPEDARPIWDWANDPETRRASFHGAPIPWEQHERWFAARRADGNGLMCMVEAPSGASVAHVRFHRDEADGVISINIAPAFRGHGWAPAILSMATAEAGRRLGFQRCVALIKVENERSRRAFQRAGYREERRLSVNRCPAVRMVHVGETPEGGGEVPCAPAVAKESR